MISVESELSRQLEALVAEMRIPMPPVDLVVRGGRIRRARHTAALGLGVAGLLAMPLTVIALAAGTGRPPETIPPANGPTSGASEPTGPTAVVVPPMATAQRDTLAEQCVTEMQRDGRISVILSAQTVTGPVVLLRVGEDYLYCSGATGNYSAVGGPGSKTGTPRPDAGHPVVTVDAGGGWDGTTWSSVLRVANNVAAVIVVVDGGEPYAAAVNDGWAIVTAESGEPGPEPSLVRTEGEVRVDGPIATVELTAFDSAGEIVWTGRSEGGVFGWPDPPPS
jgi:hypothetical protein